MENNNQWVNSGYLRGWTAVVSINNAAPKIPLSPQFRRYKRNLIGLDRTEGAQNESSSEQSAPDD